MRAKSSGFGQISKIEDRINYEIKESTLQRQHLCEQLNIYAIQAPELNRTQYRLERQRDLEESYFSELCSMEQQKMYPIVSLFLQVDPGNELRDPKNPYMYMKFLEDRVNEKCACMVDAFAV